MIPICITNAIVVGYDWWHDVPPDWFVWTSSIMFSIGLTINAIEELAS